MQNLAQVLTNEKNTSIQFSVVAFLIQSHKDVAAMNNRRTNKAITNSCPNVNSELLCNVEKTDKKQFVQGSGTNLYCKSVISVRQCQYFAVASKECYAPRLWMMVTYVDGYMCCTFHGMVLCYGQMLRTAVTLCSNFLHLITLSQTTLVMQHS